MSYEGDHLGRRVLGGGAELLAAARASLRTREPWLTLLAALVISIVTRPILPVTPAMGGEESWRSILHLAVSSQDLNFGQDILFSYGPFGWLWLPAYWLQGTGAVSLLYSFAEPVLFLGILIGVLRRRFGWAAAVALAFAFASISVDPVYEPRLPMLALVAAIAVVSHPGRPQGAQLPDRALLLALAGGVLCGFAMLGRVNAGIIAGAIVAVALLFCDRRWLTIAVFVATIAATVLAGWVLSGQSLLELPSYARYMSQVGSGYAEAMQVEHPGRHWEYFAAALAAAIVLGAAWLAATERRARWGLTAIWAVSTYYAFKQGFIRHDSHSIYFFMVMALFVMALPWQPSRRALALPLAAAAIVLAIVVTDRPLGDLIDPIDKTSNAARLARTLVDRGRRSEYVERGRAAVLAQSAIPPEYVAEMREHSSTVWPAETTIAWAAGGRLRPLRTLQAVSGYTADLDRLNAQSLTGGDRPQRVVAYAASPFENRNTAFEAPRALQALLCNYRIASRRDPFALWVPTRDRCAEPPRRLKQVRAAWGETVAVPAPSSADSFVYMRLQGTEVRGLEKLRELALKPYIREAILNGVQPARLISALAPEGIVMRAGSRLDLERPYNQAADAATIAIVRRSDSAPGGTLSFSFYEQRVAPR